jgi:hypothetical protein
MRAFYPLAAVLKIGWRIVRASPEDQALLDAHGFGSGRAYSTCREGQCRASRGGCRL